MLLDPRTQRALSIARELLSDPHGPLVADVAARSGLSLFRLIRLFRALHGDTPKQYRIGAQLALAKRLLVLDDSSVTTICMDVGFSSLGSFSTLFTQRVGEPPSHYRRRLRPLVQVPRSWSAVCPTAVWPAALAPGCFSLMAHLPKDTRWHSATAPSDPC